MKYDSVDWGRMVNFLRRQVGKPYVYGIENDPRENNWDVYKAWDCSELTEVAYAKVGLFLPDGSYNQDKACNLYEGEPLRVGDLGFKWHPDTQVIHHVAIYTGDNNVIEAKGKAWGVVATPVETFMASTDWAHWGRLKTIEN